MFTSFFYLLRARGLKVSLNEWMSLIEALDKGLHHSSFTGFYYLCRAILVKSEADFDKFDGAFLEYFKDMERATDELPKELLDWLNKPREELDGSFSEEDLLRNLGLSEQQIQQMFLERLQEQHEQHRVQRRGKRIIAHICDLLGKSLQHPVGQRIHVQDQRQRREHTQKPPGLFALV